jgi:hypothetical protein
MRGRGLVRFILYKGQGQYGSLRLHIDQLDAALTGLGHESQIIDLTAEDAVRQMQASFQDPPDCYFGISGIGSDVQIEGVSAYDWIKRPYASLYVDHPIHHQGRLATPIARNIAFFLDRSHVQFMTAWSKGRGFAQLGFMPPGANELAEPPDLSDEAFVRRDIPLLFTGTYRGPPVTPWRDEGDNPARTVMDAVAELMAADARLPLLDALRGALARLYKADLTSQLLDDFLPLLGQAQYFAEAYHRDRLLRTLGEAGTPLTVYGSGWEPLAAAYPAFTYGGVGSFEETLHLLRRTRLALNTNNGFVQGGHERVFTAMAAGAAVISDDNRYYQEAFKPGREIALFPWSKVDKVPSQIEALLGDPAALGVMARSGARRAMADHRWTTRAARLVKAVKQAG